MTKYTKEFWEKQIEQHKSASNISKNLDMKYQTVRWHLNKHNIPLSKTIRDKERLANLKEEELISLYQELGSHRLVANYLNVSKDMVLVRLPKQLRDENRCSKYQCDESFFNKENEQSFYWAGFIAADGCVKSKDGKYKQLSIGLSKKDRVHLENFKLHIDFEGPIRDKIVKASEPHHKDSEGSELVISSDQVFNSLSKFNIVPRKTHTYTFPKWLIEHELVHHFVRGYFDGDGSVGLYKQGKRPTKQCNFSILGTQDFLLNVKVVLENHKVIKPGAGYFRPKSSIYSLEYGGNGVAQSFRDWLYRDATVYLKRKRDIFFHPDVRNHERKGPTPEVFEASRKARRIPIIATNKKTQEQIHFPSIKDVAPQFHPGIVSDCIRGRQKSHRGYTFERSLLNAA
jgi:hypothetical protein